MRQAWTTRFVVIIGGILLLSSALFALVRM